MGRVPGGLGGEPPKTLCPYPNPTCRLRKVPGRETWPSIQAEVHILCPQDAYDISQLRHPSRLAALSTPLGRPPLRRDAPFSRMCPPPPRVLPSSPADMADFINDVGPLGSMRAGGTHVHACTHTHTQTHACTPHISTSVYPHTCAVTWSGLTTRDPGRAPRKLLRP